MIRKAISVLVGSTLAIASSAALAQARDTGRAISDYQSQAASLSSQPPDPTHPAEIKAMRQLADALDSIPNAPAAVSDAAKKIRSDADKLESSPKTAVHSDIAKDALTSAVGALDALSGSMKGVTALPDRIKTARTTIDQIDPSVPFLKERATIDRAFKEVGDALALVSQQVVSQAEQQRVRGQEEEVTPPPAPPPPPPQTEVVVPPAQPVVVQQPNKWFSTQLALQVGGGYASFGAKALRDITQNGGEWDFHVTLGAHSPFGVELGYVGTANQLNGRMPNVDNSAIITSNSFEGNLRLATPAFRMVPIQLYGFAGAGYNHFDLVNKNFNNSPIADNDTTFVLPAGGGLQLNLGSHFEIDGRFTYRTMFDENLLGRNHNADMYTATGRLGYVF